VQKRQPAQPPFLIRPQLAAETLRRRQRVGGLHLVVLLQHRLQPRTGTEAMHRQPHQRLAFGGGEAQGIVEAEGGIGGAEAFGVLEVAGPQLDPGPLVLHQRAAFGRQPLQVPQAEGHTADHQLPAPVERFAEAEAPRAGGQVGLDRQTEAAGQPAAEARRQHHPHPHIAQAGGGGAHQHEGFGGCQRH